MKQKDLRVYFSKKFKFVIPKSTMSDIVKNKEKLIKHNSSNKFRERGAMYPQLEEALHIWFFDMRSKHICKLFLKFNKIIKFFLIRIIFNFLIIPVKS